MIHLLDNNNFPNYYTTTTKNVVGPTPSLHLVPATARTTPSHTLDPPPPLLLPSFLFPLSRPPLFLPPSTHARLLYTQHSAHSLRDSFPIPRERRLLFSFSLNPSLCPSSPPRLHSPPKKSHPTPSFPPLLRPTANNPCPPCRGK